MTTYQGAYADICDRFLAVWTHRVVWDNTNMPASTTTDPWARVTVIHTDGETGAFGSKLFNYSGFVAIQIFVMAGQGAAAYIPLVEKVKSAYQGVRTPLGVWFKNVRMNEIGVDGRWFQVNVIADFEYSEVKNG